MTIFCTVIWYGNVDTDGFYYAELRRCVWSESYYTVVGHRWEMYGGTYVSKICPNNTKHNYQSCDRPIDTSRSSKIWEKTQNDKLCQANMCYTTDSKSKGSKWNEILEPDQLCHITETSQSYIHSCEEKVTEYCAKFSKTDDALLLCNKICDLPDCSDEAYCNGFLYGMFCKKIKTMIMIYIKPSKICDGIVDCDMEKDEIECWEPKSYNQICPVGVLKCSRGDGWMPIFNFTRCAALDNHMCSISGEIIEDSGELNINTMCSNHFDQTNCTDPMRAAITCLIKGYMTSLSAAIVCPQKHYLLSATKSESMCDDGFDNICKDPSAKCHVHKHQLCDNKVDCADQSDENAMECSEVTEGTCSRRYKHEEPLNLPLSWLGDGVSDCITGVDEQEIWPKCKVRTSFRYLAYGSVCKNVFLCGIGSTKFVKVEDLCHGLDSCTAEKSVCEKTRQFKIVLDQAYENEFHGILMKYVSYCLPGVSIGVGHHISSCKREIFQFPASGILGVIAPTQIMLPENKQDCKSFYGEQYVFMACKNRCLESSCPLKVLKPDACAALKDNRYLSVTRSGSSLTFITEDITMPQRKSVLHNNFFQCKNDRCLTYDKVCNMVDDCGDHSDEENCTNVFHCVPSNEFIPGTEKCNGKVQCSDYSDECSADCGKKIISGAALNLVCWIVGLAAVTLNFAKFIVNMQLLVKDRQLINTSFGLFINVGDFLTGSYLLSVAIIDTIVYGENYCKQQYVWLSSSLCSILGIVSTCGAQISLFSLTLLSVYRLCEVFNFRLHSLGNITIKIILITTMIIGGSLVIAVGPVLPFYEDLFVNGMTYNPQIRLFLPYVDKQTHLDIIKGYYGRIRMNETFTWKRINSLVDEMFTADYQNGTLGRRKIHFYGNDGVCLFKYFVEKNDPQKIFVWSCLGVNLFCFLVVCFCYGIINLKSRSSIENLSVNETNERMTINREKRQIHRNIAMIVLTDFVCWVPFIFVCGLHSLNIIDAIPTYSIFSIVILPMNSVINPLLYGNFLHRDVDNQVVELKFKIRGGLIGLVRQRSEKIELVAIQSKASQQPAPSQFQIPRIIITNADTTEEIINGNLIGYRNHGRPILKGLPDGKF